MAMASPAIETVVGVVQGVNQTGTGIRVADGWLNFSRNHPDVPRPVRGQRVSVQVERSGTAAWIQSLEILDGGAIQFPQRRGGSAGLSPAELREMRRLACLKAAATFCGHYATVHEDVKSTDVLKIAEAFERWVVRGGTPPTDPRT